MSQPDLRPPESPYLALVRKIVLLALWMVTLSIALVALLLWVKMRSLVLALVFSGAVVGLAAGFSVRWLLRERTAALRISAVLAFVAGSLMLLGWFTAARLGIGLPGASAPGIDWVGLAQLAGAGCIALFALYAWSKPKIVPTAAPETGPDTPPEDQENKPAEPASRMAFAKAEEPRRASRAARAAETSSSVKAAITKSRPRRVSRRKLKLRLSGEEEHRCPYCLEMIEPDDPRGVVECQICHTLHHADCWAITGACQVPHYTA